ncbi:MULTISPECIES: RND family transporter [Halorussus]|uniref:efflux RND transporter permease subunit n=1 Tax=Halorussus TaxID=1070314 RepID=UPI000E219099|nr:MULTISPECIES: MMPL family transporter [Halorussus]NHN57543.1 MMPL family transporter [Halorussus sp. JP-T4]
MSLPDRYADVLTSYSRVVLALLLVSTAVVGYGAANVDSGLTIASFGSDSTEAQKLDYIEANFATGDENTSVMQVVVRGDDVLTRESLLETLRLQQRLRDDETVGPTLREGQPTVGLSNLVATAAIRRARAGNATAANDSRGAPAPRRPTLDAQIAQLESMSQSEIDRVLLGVLDPDRAATGPVDPYTLLATDYEPGTTTASARVLFVFQRNDAGGDSLSEDAAAAQLATRDVADRTVDSTGVFVFGAGIVDELSGQATGESFAVITPFALVLVLGVLFVAYRDLLDVALGLLGTLLVLVWMGGFMGWAGVGVTQIIIAVPFLLIGLSIDYALHVVMRYREARAEEHDRSPREAMRVGLAGVAVALAATTFTTAVGFTSNLVSPIESIRQFGLVSAFGIVSAFVVFAGLLPALKLELDGLLERLGVDRRKRAFGTGGTAVNRLLGLGATAARRLPVAVVLVALAVSAAGGYAATDVDTSINQVDFLPRDSPAWMDSLPGPLRPSDYEIRENVVFLNDRFVQSRDRSQVQILVEGPVTAPDTLDRLAAAREEINDSSTAITLASGRPAVDGPLSVVRRVAAENETVARVVAERDADGDGVPDEDLAAVYDAVYAAAPEEAAGVIHRADGEYRALRLSVSVRGGSDTGAVTSEMRAVAASVESGTDLTVTATGQPIINEIVNAELLLTLVETFLITLGVIVAFLTAVFYRRYGTLSLGAVTMVPVVFALSWILGAMYLLDIPFTTETAIIASIAIGIGVDYSIHISERFVDELSAAGDPVAALETTLAGTGGALLASAVTTAGGFGVLLLALVPSLQRFGAVTGTAIVFAFASSVVVLPSLLVLWYRYLGAGTPVGGSAAGTAGD